MADLHYRCRECWHVARPVWRLDGRDWWWHLLWPWPFLALGAWLDREMAARLDGPLPVFLVAAAAAVALVALVLFAASWRRACPACGSPHVEPQPGLLDVG